jgi:hypothetical protein
MKTASRLAILTLVLSLPAAGQDFQKPPVIGARSYVSGSARIQVTGSFQINEDVAINKQASFSDGEMTWLQFGVSGAETPNALLTVSPDEVGITVSRGKWLATAGAEACTGKMVVTAVSVLGRYSCPGVTAHNPGVAGLGKVDIEFAFTTGS